MKQDLHSKTLDTQGYVEVRNKLVRQIERLKMRKESFSPSDKRSSFEHLEYGRLQGRINALEDVLDIFDDLYSIQEKHEPLTVIDVGTPDNPIYMFAPQGVVNSYTNPMMNHFDRLFPKGFV